MGNTPFTLRAVQDSPPVRPKEPLYSLLCEAPIDAVKYLYSDLTAFDDDRQLEEVMPATGLTRAESIAQVLLVLEARRQ